MFPPLRLKEYLSTIPCIESSFRKTVFSYRTGQAAPPLNSTDFSGLQPERGITDEEGFHIKTQRGRPRKRYRRLLNDMSQRIDSVVSLFSILSTSPERWIFERIICSKVYKFKSNDSFVLLYAVMPRDCTFATHSALSRYHFTVSFRPSSKVWVGFQPSSEDSFEKLIA